jgi:antitoxin VapB
MGTQLNIKSGDAYRLASELSQLTGESLTTAVTEALRERLERERAARQPASDDWKARSARIMALARELRSHMREPVSSADHADIYGPDGMPG